MDASTHSVGDPDPARPGLRQKRRWQHRLRHRFRRSHAAQAAARCQDRRHRVGRCQRRSRRAHRAPQRSLRRLAAGAASQTSRPEQAGRAPRLLARRQHYGVGNVELHSSPRLDGADVVADPAVRYLDQLPLTPEQIAIMLGALGERDPGSEPLRARMLALHSALAGSDADPENPTLASVRRRLELAYASSDIAHPPPLTHDALGRDRLVTAPPLARTSMVPRAWPRGLLARWFLRFARHDDPRLKSTDGDRARASERPDLAQTRRQGWRRAATFRRLVLMGLIVSQTYIASNFMVAVLPYHGRQPLEIAILVLFAILFGWV